MKTKPNKKKHEKKEDNPHKEPTGLSTKDQEEESRSKTYECHYEIHRSRLNNAAQWANIIIALCTVVLAYYTSIQVDNSNEFNRRTVAIADSTMKIGDRAYLNIEFVAWDKLPRPRSPLRVTVRIKNSGNSPAFRVRQFCELDTTLSGFQAEFQRITKIVRDTTDPDVSENMIGPGVQIALSPRVIVRNDTITTQGFQMLQSAKMQIYAYGLIEYLDIFGRKHFTRFCYFFNKKLTGDSFGASNKYNEAD